MTKPSPRIYTYKITFEEVPYYYYGVHKEKKFGEEYWGSPITNKWAWELYTLRKQILELFEYSDEGWVDAQKIEKRLIKPFYNSDKWCLNACCGGTISLQRKRQIGKKLYEDKKGIHGMPKDQKSEYNKKAGQKTYEMKVGVHGRTKGQMSEHGRAAGRVGGARSYQMGVGIHAMTKEEKREIGKKAYELGTGVHAMTKEEKRAVGKAVYESGLGVASLTKEQRSKYSKKGIKITNSQVWECTVTGHRTNSGALSNYQKKRGIDTSNRIRIS